MHSNTIHLVLDASMILPIFIKRFLFYFSWSPKIYIYFYHDNFNCLEYLDEVSSDFEPRKYIEKRVDKVMRNKNVSST